jgi:hypothetical protein
MKIVRYKFGSPSDLVVGANVYVELVGGVTRFMRELATDGSTTVSQIAVGRNGAKPTMLLRRPSVPGELFSIPPKGGSR